MDTKFKRSWLRKLEDKDGRLTPEAVVEAARSEDDPMHSYFEWDDAKAGEKYRVDQARTLIRSVRVEVEVGERVVKTVAYVRDPSVSDDAQGYRAVRRIAADPDDARAALVAEFARAASALKRARDLAVAFDLAEQIGEMVERLTKMSENVEARAN